MALPPSRMPISIMFRGRTRASTSSMAATKEAGSWLSHFLERLLPSVVEHEGYRYAMTRIPGVTWHG
jgi:hypothetical protein